MNRGVDLGGRRIIKKEKAIVHINRTLTLENKIETIFLLTSSAKSFISSSSVREIISLGGDYTLFVPDAVRV